MYYKQLLHWTLKMWVILPTVFDYYIIFFRDVARGEVYKDWVLLPTKCMLFTENVHGIKQ